MTHPAARQTLEQIAQLLLLIPTLEERNSDSLDFHDLHVCTLAKALQAAYEAGAASTATKPPSEPSPEAEEWMQTAPIKVLTQSANRRLDLNRAVLEELASRGMDHSGKWVGFPAARKIMFEGQ